MANLKVQQGENLECYEGRIGSRALCMMCFYDPHITYETYIGCNGAAQERKHLPCRAVRLSRIHDRPLSYI